MSWFIRYVSVTVFYWVIGALALFIVAANFDGIPDGQNLTDGYATLIALVVLALGYGLLIKQMRIAQQGGYRGPES